MESTLPTLFVCFTFLFFNFDSSHTVDFTAENFESVTESLHMSLTEATYLVKLFALYQSSRETVNIFDFFKPGNFYLKNEEELKMFKDSNRIFEKVIKNYLLSAIGVYTTCFIAVAFGNRWVLPYPAWMPFDLHSKYYWYAYAFQYFGITVSCITHVSFDMLMLFLLHQISLMYRIMRIRLGFIGFDLDLSNADEEVNKIVLKDLKDIIEVNTFAKMLTKKSQELIYFPLFNQIMLDGLVLCFTLYQTRSLSPREHPGELIAVADFLLVTGIQMFIMCYYGNRVTVESGKLSPALNDSNWINLPIKSKKLIFLYMEFLKEPVYLKAGPFFEIGLPVFGKTINNAYSYCALLLQMKDRI